LTLHTIETLMDWLSDESQFCQFFGKEPCEEGVNGFDFFGIRKRFRLSNGKGVSIQQSALHYCTPGSVQMGGCHHSSLLLPYDTRGGGYGPYALVPLHVVVDYLNEQENL
jgi:hypothetical protein